MAGRCDGLVVLGRTVSDDVVEQLAARGTQLVLVARPPIGDARLGQRREPRQRRRARRSTCSTEGVRRLTLRRRPRRLARRRRALAGRLGGGRRQRARRRDRAGRRATTSTRTPAPPSPSEALDRDDLPDAFVCANDELALGLLGRLRAAGVDVPGAGQGHRLGRRDGRPLRRPDHRPPADARARRHRRPAARRADHRQPHRTPPRAPAHRARDPHQHAPPERNPDETPPHPTRRTRRRIATAVAARRPSPASP